MHLTVHRIIPFHEDTEFRLRPLSWYTMKHKVFAQCYNTEWVLDLALNSISLSCLFFHPWWNTMRHAVEWHHSDVDTVIRGQRGFIYYCRASHVAYGITISFLAWTYQNRLLHSWNCCSWWVGADTDQQSVPCLIE